LWANKPPGADETLDPMLFVKTYERLGGTGRALVPQIGEEIDLTQ